MLVAGYQKEQNWCSKYSAKEERKNLILSVDCRNRSKTWSVRPLRGIFYHFYLFLFVAALFIEWYIPFVAVQNRLVGTFTLANRCQCLYDAETKFFALLTLIHHDVFNVSHQAYTALELELHEYGTQTDDLIGLLVDDDK